MSQSGVTPWENVWTLELIRFLIDNGVSYHIDTGQCFFNVLYC